MSSHKQQEISSEPSAVSNFYRGKSLFITGAAGFLGVVLLEIFLRCCPDIRRIYILLRPKKGVQPEDRKEAIFKKEIFRKIKEKDPDSIDKVVVVSGDISQENLGMREDDIVSLSEEVSVVFHCAAAISFLKSLRKKNSHGSQFTMVKEKEILDVNATCQHRHLMHPVKAGLMNNQLLKDSFMIQQNVIGTVNVVEFCRKLKKLDALVYTSTAYSNCNLKTIEEKVYDMPFDINDAIQCARKDDNEQLNIYFSMCNPVFPNYYTFSKCISENFLRQKTNEMPISIVRPSIIVCSMKGVMPGYIEYGSGLVSLSVGIGKGFIRVLRADEDKIIDQIPADVVANTHILAAYRQATESLSSPVVYNCTSGELAPYTWGQFVSTLMKMVMKYPLPKSYQRPGVTICKSALKYNFFSILDHYTPAVVIDFLLWISGKKLRLVKLYQFYDKCMKAMEPFTMNEWVFKCENFKSLDKTLNSTDEELFPVHLRDYTLDELTRCLREGAPVYNRSKDNKPYEERLRIAYLRYFLTSLIKWSVLGGIASIFYVLVF